jgi:hypothetical protein
MEGTASCKMIGKCEMFHVVLFVTLLYIDPAKTLLLRGLK